MTYLAGVAGSGKSTILPYVIEDLGLSPDTVSFTAPTGKAAKIVRNKLRAIYPTATASTIHSMIYRAKPAPIGQLEDNVAEHEREYHAAEVEGVSKATLAKMLKMIMRLRLELSEAYREDKLHFQLNPDSAIALSRLIVVDEASMVGDIMTEDLLSFGIPILAIGDPAQLPPIEQKPGLTAGVPDAFLTEVHRQAAGNPILHLATLAREGKDIPIGKYGDTAEVIRRKDYDPVLDIDDLPKFIVGTNKTRWRINQMMREEFGFVERAGDYVGPQAGEPMIVCKNHKEYVDLPNGSECVVVSAAPMQRGDTHLEMSFEDEEGIEYAHRKVFQGLFEEHFSRKPGGFTSNERSAFKARKTYLNCDFAWAITCHKSQGSEYKDVVLVDESSVFRKDCDRWLYTGITRASNTLKILV